MSVSTQETGWQPAVRLDLDTANTSSLEEALTAFKAWATDKPLTSLVIKSGWVDLTPQIAEDLLRRNRGNRKVALRYVKKYARAMLLGRWKRTGQSIVFDTEGWLQEGQHRLWAAYFSGATFTTFVVTDASAEPNLFAYIDNGKTRSAADALYTAGNNGCSAMVAAAVKIAWRYDNNALKVMSLPRIRDMEPDEVLDYVNFNKALTDTAHILIANFAKAVDAIGNKGVAAFFAWKVAAMYGNAMLDTFLSPLGSGANMAEDSPILAVRNRLLKFGKPEEEMKMPQRLGLLIKAFNMHLNGQTMKVTKRQGAEPLFLTDNEDFPRFIEPESLPLAAE